MSGVVKVDEQWPHQSGTFAFGEWIVAFAEPIRFYPIARYATEITKQI